MSTVIKLKRGTNTPTASDIINGEVAIDTLARKFYVNDSGTIKTIGNVGSFNIIGDDSTEESINLGETLNIIGGTGISTSTSANSLSIGIDSSVVTTTGSQTLTNKTIGATSVSGDIVPTSNEVYDLGTSSNRFRDLYLSGNTIHIGNAAISFGSNTLTITDSGGGSITIDTSGSGSLLTAETNDLSSAVTWANVPDANITESSVTQHEGALSITESQISDLGTYLTAETNDLSSAVTWANVPNANITESSVTQHQAALSITESQISDLGTYLTDITSESIGSLSDVTITTPNSGQVLKYNGSAWVNDTDGGGFSADANSNMVGGDAQTAPNVTGTNNVVIGADAGNALTSGSKNVIIGSCAGYFLSTGECNIAIGYRAGANLTYGSRNISIGYCAATCQSTGNGNISIGTCANHNGLYTAVNNVAIGEDSMRCNVSGQNNTAIGHSALGQNASSSNVAVGGNALSGNTTGFNNTAIGRSAGSNLTTGCNNTAIGYYAQASSAFATNEITLGNSSVSTVRTNGNIVPFTDAASDLGTTDLRWNNVYTTDLHMSNEGKLGGNDIDGTTGDWTLQEGHDQLYIINNKNGKRFKFDLTEIV